MRFTPVAPLLHEHPGRKAQSSAAFLVFPAYQQSTPGMQIDLHFHILYFSGCNSVARGMGGEMSVSTRVSCSQHCSAELEEKNAHRIEI